MTTGIYITKCGATIEKKPIFITANEWEMLWELSASSSTPIGTLIVKLALAETDRLKLTPHNRLLDQVAFFSQKGNIHE